MEQLWARIQRLTGHTLQTPRQQQQQQRFVVVFAGEQMVTVQAEDGQGAEFPIHRDEIEQAVRLGLHGGKLTVRAIQKANPTGLNAAYVAAIIRAAEGGDVGR